MWTGGREWARSMQTSVSHGRAHKGATNESGSQTPESRMTPVTSRRLCILVCPVQVRWAHERTGHGVRDGVYTRV